ncbi:MAG: hypothetical protein GEV06_14650 [Luteitalea sp.]|nr:hypothetical protein [Luteitalea sp.]
MNISTGFGMTLLIVGTMAGSATAQEAAHRSRCKAIHAAMAEDLTTACKPDDDSCFIGEVAGNHGLRGTTYFRADGSGTSPDTSPDFVPYSGQFEYSTKRGTLIMRETGIVNQTQGNLDSGAVTAFQKIVDATGDWAGTTGYFFVNGFSREGHVQTRVSGEICRP